MNYRYFSSRMPSISPAMLILGIVLGIALFLLLFFLCRLLNCWYFKINHRLREQQRTNELLEELNRKLDRIGADLASGNHTPPVSGPQNYYQVPPPYQAGQAPYQPGQASRQPEPAPFQSASPYAPKPFQDIPDIPGTDAFTAGNLGSGTSGTDSFADPAAQPFQEFKRPEEDRPALNGSKQKERKEAMPDEAPVPSSSVLPAGNDSKAEDAADEDETKIIIAGPAMPEDDPGIPLDEIEDYGPAFCPNCHLPLTKDTVFCPNCGRKVR